MNHIAQSRIRPEIGQKQFVQDTGTRNAIYMIKVLSEQAVQVHGNQYQC